MEKIKRFIDLYVPITGCTLRCPYCYITIHRKFDNKVKDFPFSPEHVRKALSKERLGGTCMFNLCAGGETLLSPTTVEYARVLLEEGHYVMVVTNATVDRSFEVIAEFPKELMRRLFFKFSYHYMQLKERGLLERFFRNVKKMRDAGASFTLEVTPYDELVPYADEMVALAEKEVGAAPHFTIARDENHMGVMPKLTKMNDEEYRATWGRFNSKLFDFKMDIFQRPRREFCYAGDWVSYVSLENGMMFTCHDSMRDGMDVFSDVTKPIPFKPVGNNCKAPHCWNGHVWIALGAIPEMDAPCYSELRNRRCADGSEWLKPDMKSFMSSKLCESNRELSSFGKLRVNMGFGKHWYTNLGRNLKLAFGKRP